MKKYYFKGTNQEVKLGDKITQIITCSNGKQFKCNGTVDEATIKDLLNRDSIEVKVVVPVQKSIYRKHISARDVLVSGAMNMTYQIYANKFTVEIDSKQILYGTNAKLYDICKLINFGVLGIGSYPILTESFDYFKDNLDYMYEYYIREKEALNG